MQELQESLVEARQTQQLQQDSSIRIATFVSLNFDQRPHDFHSPFKMEVPHFDGTFRWHRSSWLDFLNNQFFNFHHTPEEQQLPMVSFYMDSPALGWYKWVTTICLLLGQILSMHYNYVLAPLIWKILKGNCSKWHKQPPLVIQSKFEALSNKNIGFSPHFF